MIAGILLAAGGARRFGSQKLVEVLDGRPLVCHAAGILAAETGLVVAVVGNDADVVRNALDGTGARVVENADWKAGLSSSLRAGVAALPPDVDAALVCLGDQPRIDADVIRRVVEVWRKTGTPIVSARYRGMRGHPVLFSRAVFLEIAGLRGDVGAKMLIEQDSRRVAYVDVDAAVPIDVDSPADLTSLDNGWVRGPAGEPNKPQ